MLSLVLALTLQAAEPAPSLPQGVEAATTDERKRADAGADVVCQRRVETGTSIRREICLTRAQWRKLDREFQSRRTSGHIGATKGAFR